jgi:hypothetical protein
MLMALVYGGIEAGGTKFVCAAARDIDGSATGPVSSGQLRWQSPQ